MNVHFAREKRRFIAPSSRERGGLIRRAIAGDAHGGSRPTELKMENRTGGRYVDPHHTDGFKKSAIKREGGPHIYAIFGDNNDRGVDIYNICYFIVFTHTENEIFYKTTRNNNNRDVTVAS